MSYSTSITLLSSPQLSSSLSYTILSISLNLIYFTYYVLHLCYKCILNIEYHGKFKGSWKMCTTMDLKKCVPSTKNAANFCTAVPMKYSVTNNVMFVVSLLRQILARPCLRDFWSLIFRLKLVYEYYYLTYNFD